MKIGMVNLSCEVLEARFNTAALYNTAAYSILQYLELIIVNRASRPIHMEKFYTLFSATDELLTCPAMFHFSKTHNRLLKVGREDVVTFTLPKRLKKTHYSDICLTFNPDMIEIKSAVVTEDVGIFYTVATLSVTLITRDIGYQNRYNDSPSCRSQTSKNFLDAHLTPTTTSLISPYSLP